jgi:hydroxymethylglutaryl-CoA lyase
MLRLADRVEVVEVAPRDGLQSLARVVPTGIKLRVVELLMDAGLRTIEVTATARPDVIPQLADATEVLARVQRRPGVTLRALAPNRRGAERALAAGADALLGLVCCSETYSRRNQNMSVSEGLEQVREIAALARPAGRPLTVALGLAFFCPYEGDIPARRVLEIVGELQAVGIDRLYLASSAGMADPAQVARLCETVLAEHPDARLGVHLHDTNGMALAGALAALDAGVRIFEGSICGIGGGIAMPAALPGCGNVATEDLVAMFEAMGVATGVDLHRLREAGREIAALLDVEPSGRFLRVGTKGDVLERRRRQTGPASQRTLFDLAATIEEP